MGYPDQEKEFLEVWENCLLKHSNHDNKCVCIVEESKYFNLYSMRTTQRLESFSSLNDAYTYLIAKGYRQAESK